MDEPGFMAMGGQTEAISNLLRERHDTGADLVTALALAAEALGSVGGENGATRKLEAKQLEVAVLDRRRKGRTFRRITGAALTQLLGGDKNVAEKDLGDVDAAPPNPAEDKPTVSAAPVIEADASKNETPPATGDAPKNEAPGAEGDADSTGEGVNGDNS